MPLVHIFVFYFFHLYFGTRQKKRKRQTLDFASFSDDFLGKRSRWLRFRNRSALYLRNWRIFQQKALQTLPFDFVRLRSGNVHKPLRI